MKISTSSDDTIQKKLLKRKEISLDPSLNLETPIVDLSSDKHMLFDEDDDVRTSTIPDLSLPSEDEEEEAKSNDVRLLTPYINFLHFILKEKVSENRSNISRHGDYGKVFPKE